MQSAKIYFDVWFLTLYWPWIGTSFGDIFSNLCQNCSMWLLRKVHESQNHRNSKRCFYLLKELNYLFSFILCLRVYFRNNRKANQLYRFVKYIFKNGDYFIGEFKDGFSHRYGRFTFMDFIYNTAYLQFCMNKIKGKFKLKWRKRGIGKGVLSKII